VIVGIGYGGSSGITTLVGNALGEKEHEKARLFASKGLGILLLLGCIMGIFGVLSAPSMLSMLSVEETYRPLTLSYIQIILLGTTFFFATFGLNAILVATGDTKSYRNSLIFGFFANIALNPLFIYGAYGIPSMGIGGIAFATVLIQIINTVYLTCKVFKTGLMHLSFFIPDTKCSRITIEQSLPSALNMLMISFGSLIALYFVSHYGFKAVAGYGIGYRVEQLFLLPCLGISSATLSLVSNNMGAKRFDRVRQTILTSLLYGYGVALIGLGILFLTHTWLISRFDNDVEVIAYGSDYITVMMLLFFGYVTHFVCVATLQGMKRPIMIFYVGAFRQLFAPSIVYFFIVYVWHLAFIWMWIGLGLIVYSSALVLLWYTYRIVNTYFKENFS
jgi:putative MATE family efflux protein